MNRWAASALVLTIGAAAQAEAPRVQAEVKPSRVAPGQSFRLQITATTSDGSKVQDVSVSVPQGVKKLGEQRGSSSSFSFSNGKSERRGGMNLTLTLSAARAGKFTLGPIRVTVDGVSYAADGPVVLVDAQAAADDDDDATDPFSPNYDPFAGLGGVFGGLFGSPNDPRGRPTQEPLDPSLGLARAPAQGLFLHASATPTQLILGQSLRFEVRQYLDENYREPSFDEVKEAATDDFLSVPLEMRARPRLLGRTQIGDATYQVRLMRRFALTPTRPGTLRIGSMQVRVNQPGGAVQRQSEALEIVVREPPAKGRPNGYELGTVGRYEVQLDALPPQAQLGDRLALTIRVQGDAKPPGKLVFDGLPSGVEVSAPDIKDTELGARQGVLDEVKEPPQLQRTYHYLLTVREPGTLDLGTVALPTYLVEDKRYEVQRVALGRLEVHAAPSPAPSDSAAPPTPVAAAPAPPESLRDALGAALPEPLGARPSAAPLPQLAYAAPFVLPGLGWLFWLWDRMQRQRKDRPRATKNEAQRALDELLQSAHHVRDLQRFGKALVCAALERRGAPSAQLGASRESWNEALRDAGVRDDAIARLSEFLEALDAARFGASEDSGSEWVRRAREFKEEWL